MLQLYEKDYSRALSLANEHDTIDMDVILKTQRKNACEEGTVTVDAVTEILVGAYGFWLLYSPTTAEIRQFAFDDGDEWVLCNLLITLQTEIRDIEFRAAACWASKTTDRRVQKALIDLGMDMGGEAPAEVRDSPFFLFFLKLCAQLGAG